MHTGNIRVEKGGGETVKFHKFGLLYSIKKVLIHKLSRRMNYLLMGGYCMRVFLFIERVQFKYKGGNSTVMGGGTKGFMKRIKI